MSRKPRYVPYVQQDPDTAPTQLTQAKSSFLAALSAARHEMVDRYFRGRLWSKAVHAAWIIDKKTGQRWEVTPRE